MSDAPSMALFSYGTLQQETVQMASFGRVLEGTADGVPGFRRETLEIPDADVVRISGERFHAVVVPSTDPTDVVFGTAFRITRAELEAADRYEVDDYERIEVRLLSGIQAWVYVKA